MNNVEDWLDFCYKEEASNKFGVFGVLGKEIGSILGINFKFKDTKVYHWESLSEKIYWEKIVYKPSADEIKKAKIEGEYL